MQLMDEQIGQFKVNRASVLCFASRSSFCDYLTIKQNTQIMGDLRNTT